MKYEMSEEKKKQKTKNMMKFIINVIPFTCDVFQFQNKLCINSWVYLIIINVLYIMLY